MSIDMKLRICGDDNVAKVAPGGGFLRAQLSRVNSDTLNDFPLRPITLAEAFTPTGQMRHIDRGRMVFVFVGMPGAGKSLASQVAGEMKMPIFVSGDIIRNEAKRRGLNPNKKNLGALMLRIRESEGMGAVARRLVPLIKESSSRNVVYEGARNIEEVEELAKHYKVSTIAIHASPETRFHRLLRRKRSDRPRTRADFFERDKRELTVGVGRVISLADRMVENEDSIPALKRRMRRVLRAILAQDQSR